MAKSQVRPVVVNEPRGIKGRLLLVVLAVAVLVAPVQMGQAAKTLFTALAEFGQSF
uniref:hypothetical protein n=1 Tax=Saccharothrix espanaensis TaxID=103731 RepID=UPI003F491904